MCRDAQEIIIKEFGVGSNAEVFFCTINEFKQRFATEEMDTKFSPDIRELILKRVVPILEGKVWKNTNEIWLINGKGDNLGTLIHEYIHSIHVCRPHREPIVEYLSMIICEDHNISYNINRNLYSEWEMIEKDVGFETIKKQILKKGDCEDF